MNKFNNYFKISKIIFKKKSTAQNSSNRDISSPNKHHVKYMTHSNNPDIHQQSNFQQRHFIKKRPKSSLSKSSRFKKIFKSFLIFSCILCILLIVLYFYIDSKLSLINTIPSQEDTQIIYKKKTDTNNANETVIPEETTAVDGTKIVLVTEEFEETEIINPELEIIEPEDVVWNDDFKETNLSEISNTKDITNILLIGQDKRENESRQRSDSMILCSITNDSIIITSFMRDLYVQIPGFSDNRMNAAYQFGGMELLNDTIEKNFGVHIDGDIEVDFQSFVEVINIIGNIDIHLSAAEANYLNNSNNLWNLKAGTNSLNGEQSLAYSRIRYIGNADYERTSRQRTVLLNIFDNLKYTNINDLLTLSDYILPLLTTNISKRDLLSYLYQMIDARSKSIETYRIPIDGSFNEVVIRNMEVLLPNLDENRNFIQKTIYN